jgi:hypothetical protein
MSRICNKNYDIGRKIEANLSTEVKMYQIWINNSITVVTLFHTSYASNYNVSQIDRLTAIILSLANNTMHDIENDCN